MFAGLTKRTQIPWKSHKTQGLPTADGTIRAEVWGIRHVELLPLSELHGVGIESEMREGAGDGKERGYLGKSTGEWRGEAERVCCGMLCTGAYKR